jgi:hypothetical protein
MTAASDKAAADKAAADKAATDKAAANIPATTAVPVGEDVQKIAIVSGAEQRIDQQATREQIDIDRNKQEALARNNPASVLDDSGFVFVDDPITNKRYVARLGDDDVSVHGTPRAALHVTPLSLRRCEPGTLIYLDEETVVSVPDGVREWTAVRDSDGKEVFVADKSIVAAREKANKAAEQKKAA